MQGLEVIHDRERSRFRATLDGMDSVLDYDRAPGAIRILHVGVPVSLRNRGIAGQITRAALEWAKAEGLAVVPLCPYADAYVRRHPEYQPLVREPE